MVSFLKVSRYLALMRGVASEAIFWGSFGVRTGRRGWEGWVEWV